MNESKKTGTGRGNMEFDAVLLPPRRAESVARGYWLDRTINDDLDARLAHCPDKLALTAVRRESGEVRRFTYRELAKLADPKPRAIP
jgi:cyclohexanecarboxylate-CoA ligase